MYILHRSIYYMYVVCAPSLTVVAPNRPGEAVVSGVVNRDEGRLGVLGGGEGGRLALAAVELRLLLAPAHAHEL